MAEWAEFRISLTETEQYRRLVEFLEDVDEHAHMVDDIHLMDLVDDCKDALAELTGKVAPDPWQEGTEEP